MDTIWPPAETGADRWRLRIRERYVEPWRAYRRQAAQQAAGGESLAVQAEVKMTLTTAKQAANAGVFGRDVPGCLAGERVYRRDAEGDLWIRANSGSGTITDAPQPGAALNIANAMSRVNSPSQLGTWAESLMRWMTARSQRRKRSSCWMQSGY